MSETMTMTAHDDAAANREKVMRGLADVAAAYQRGVEQRMATFARKLNEAMREAAEKKQAGKP